ncbi:hypothetical protein QZH41_002806 [Actinostola sp. cb2023]|nr:hypothetical protein QZH41_002806 [Actinostola sp. cb2023]
MKLTLTLLFLVGFIAFIGAAPVEEETQDATVADPEKETAADEDASQEEQDENQKDEGDDDESEEPSNDEEDEPENDEDKPETELAESEQDPAEDNGNI